MFKDITSDETSIVAIRNSKQLYDSDINYDEYREKKAELQKEWSKLEDPKKQEYKNKIKNYFQKNLPSFSDSELYKGKNYSLINTEAKKRIATQQDIQLLSISPLHINQSLIELIENLENDQNIKNLYKIRKLNIGSSKNAGIQTEEALRLKNCLRQGRELFLSGKAGSLMVKPLNFFYSLTAYAYALIIINNPLRYSIDHLPGSHGLIYIRDGLKIQFGGDTPHGTFSELACSFPTFSLRDNQIELTQNNINTNLSFFNNKVITTIGTLLSLIPEIREYYKLVTGRNSRTHPLIISTKSEARNIYYEIQIGNGTELPNRTKIEESFINFKIQERHGKLIINVPTADAHRIQASIYTDSNGMFWFVENPFHPIVLSEFCVHFLLINAFSNIMRYAPDQWGDILLNNVDSKLSLITRKYISSLENKFMFLVLRNISEYYPIVA